MPGDISGSQMGVRVQWVETSSDVYHPARPNSAPTTRKESPQMSVMFRLRNPLGPNEDPSYLFHEIKS